MAEDYRLLGALDGLVSGMLVLRREIGNQRSRLGGLPRTATRKRAAIQTVIDMLTRLDAELDHRRRECSDEWRRRQAVEIVSPHRPEPLVKLQ